VDDPEPMSFPEWQDFKSGSIPQFKFWNLVLELELMILEIVHAIQTADFELYLEALDRLVGWTFALKLVFPIKSCKNNNFVASFG